MSHSEPRRQRGSSYPRRPRTRQSTLTRCIPRRPRQFRSFPRRRAPQFATKTLRGTSSRRHCKLAVPTSRPCSMTQADTAQRDVIGRRRRQGGGVCACVRPRSPRTRTTSNSPGGNMCQRPANMLPARHSRPCSKTQEGTRSRPACCSRPHSGLQGQQYMPEHHVRPRDTRTHTLTRTHTHTHTHTHTLAHTHYTYRVRTHTRAHARKKHKHAQRFTCAALAPPIQYCPGLQATPPGATLPAGQQNPAAQAHGPAHEDDV